MRSRYRSIYDSVSKVHFVTSTVVGFENVFIHERLCRAFTDTLSYYITRGDFVLLAWVLMPNHFHLVLYRSHNLSISQIIGNIKRYSAKKVITVLREIERDRLIQRLSLAAAREPASDASLWKPRFDSFVITSPDTLRQKIEYIHNNPLRKGFVSRPELWRYSSAACYVGGEDSIPPVDVEWQCIEG